MKPVLLVDDSATMLLSMSSIITRAGMPCETASSAEAAIAKVNQGVTPSIVITDYHMPGMHGVELIEKLRRIAATRFVPMLVLTTDSDQGKRSAAKTAGATGWLVKPVDQAQLLQVLKQLVPAA